MPVFLPRLVESLQTHCRSLLPLSQGLRPRSVPVIRITRLVPRRIARRITEVTFRTVVSSRVKRSGGSRAGACGIVLFSTYVCRAPGGDRSQSFLARRETVAKIRSSDRSRCNFGHFGEKTGRLPSLLGQRQILYRGHGGGLQAGEDKKSVDFVTNFPTMANWNKVAS